MRIDELLALKAGWLDGASTVPSPDGLEWLRKEFTEYWPDEVPLPFIYPTPGGGIRLEWSSAEWEISAEIDLETKRGEFFATPLNDEDSEKAALNLVTPSDWKTVTQWIAKFAPMEPEAVGGMA